MGTNDLTNFAKEFQTIILIFILIVALILLLVSVLGITIGIKLVKEPVTDELEKEKNQPDYTTRKIVGVFLICMATVTLIGFGYIIVSLINGELGVIT